MKGAVTLAGIMIGLLIIGGILAGLYATGYWRTIETTLNVFLSLFQVSITIPELRPVGILVFGPMIIGLVYILARLVRGGG